MFTTIKRASRTSKDTNLTFIYSSFGIHTLSQPDTIISNLEAVDVEEFRSRAFLPKRPILITTRREGSPNSVNSRSSEFSIPAADKWFDGNTVENEPLRKHRGRLPSQYLSRFRDTILPYEFILDSHAQSTHNEYGGELSVVLQSLLKEYPDHSFHRFNAPLSLFLEACQHYPRLPKLYIAQAQIADLPKELQDDLQTPKIVKQAGKGDIYDANIWMGIPPTYTPLHRDPNPNLFVQLSSSKFIRLFEPGLGRSIFWNVQQQIGQNSSSTFRGEEMMEGPERDALDMAVWGRNVPPEGVEVILAPGDALFIPQGWWHSIKSVGEDINASVNWWFR
ncbi:hypothetical protein BGZ60DRAFT_529102 [Tricladium varicosporioides]|nr:hypothetical protein BGZ60DRAFT_529102 [Hymenoscyphus varicosporioides]